MIYKRYKEDVKGLDSKNFMHKIGIDLIKQSYLNAIGCMIEMLYKKAVDGDGHAATYIQDLQEQRTKIENENK